MSDRFDVNSVYKPFSERTPDRQYLSVLEEILAEDNASVSQQETDSISRIAPRSMRFKLANGFPVIADRNMAPKLNERLPVTIWQQAIGEICGFINGAHTVEELEKFGCYWWKDWCTERKCSKRGLPTGDLGPGSYGVAFHDFPRNDGTTFNQFQNVIEEIKELPHLRTHFISPWIPYTIPRRTGLTQKVVVAPCHGWVHLRIINNKLTLHMFQRSGDVPIGVPSNMVQYGALLMMIAHVTGTEPYEYVHTISDAHIFVDQVEGVKKMLVREPLRLPTVKMNTEKTNLFDFRREDFELSDYEPHPGIKMPVAI